jgi:hypothetical protein
VKEASDDAGLDVDVEVEAPAGKRSGGTVALIGVLAVVAATAGYFLAPRLFGARQDPAPPLTLEVKPHAPPVPSAPAVRPSEPAPVTPSPVSDSPVAVAPVAAVVTSEATADAISGSPAPAVPGDMAKKPAAGPESPAPVPAPKTVAGVEPPPAKETKRRPVDTVKAAPVPKGGKALLARADRLRERGGVAEALEIYGRVAADDPENVEALTGRGLCYLDLSRYPPAVASFEAALRVAPRNADALLGLAEANRWQGRDAEAIRYYEKYLSEHPNGEEAAVARNALADLRR